MDFHNQEETKRPRESLYFSESEEDTPRKRSKGGLNLEQIVSIYDLVEELQCKEDKFYNGLQRQLEVFHLSQQERYDELRRDIHNIERRLLGEKVSRPKYETSRQGSFSTDKNSLKSDFSCTGSSETQPEVESPKSLGKARSPIRNRNKTKSPFTPVRVASPPPPPSPSPLPTSSLSSPPPPSTSPPPPSPPLPQSERARRKVPKKNYEPKLSIEGDDEFVLPPPKYDGSDGEFIPNSAPRDHDDEPSPHNSPTKNAKKGKSKPRKSNAKGQGLPKESLKELEAISKSIGTPGIAKKETIQSSLLGYWSNGAKEAGKPRKTPPSKRSAIIPQPLPPPLSTPPPPSPPPPLPPPNPVAKWRVEAPKLPVSATRP